VAAFWKGIGAAWLREASYTSLRLGLYAPIKHAMGVKNDSHFVFKFAAGSAAGAIGSIAGNPFDVLKTRMMASAAVHSPKLMETASTLYKQQGMFGSLGFPASLGDAYCHCTFLFVLGIGGFYRGIDANIMRAMVLNGTKMACYDQIKGMITKSGYVPSGR
jgi:hypothetical protein